MPELHDDLTGGHEIPTGDMLGYRYYPDGDLTVYLNVGETTDTRASHVFEEQKWRRIFEHATEHHGAVISVENGDVYVDVTADGHGGVRLTGIDTGDELFLSADDIERIKEHLRDCETHLDYGL